MPGTKLTLPNTDDQDLPSKLAPIVNELLGRSRGYETWFGQLLQMTMTITAAGKYTDFGVLAPAALEWVAKAEGIELPADAWDRMKAAMGELQAFPEVPAGLDALVANGWRLIAFSNSGQAAVDKQLTGAGIHGKFEAVLSVEAVGQFKPTAATYRYALEKAGVKPEEAIMVACHDWDLEGAKAVGMNTAFVKRHGQEFASVYTPPDLLVPDFTALAEQLGSAK